jgi:hypothetical protein
MAIWQDLVTDHGFAGSYESVKRFVRRIRGARAVEACGIIQTAPDGEAQVDYGTGPMCGIRRRGDTAGCGCSF